MSSIGAKLSNFVKFSPKLSVTRDRTGYARHRPRSVGAEIVSNEHIYPQPAQPDFIPDTLDHDLTPFVQGLYWHVTLLGHQEVAWHLKDKESINQLVRLMVPEQEPQGATRGAQDVTIKVTTLQMCIKDKVSQGVEYDFPISRLIYCGTDTNHPDTFIFVTKEDRIDSETPTHQGYVFRCVSPEKARTLALCVAKAYHLAFRVWKDEQGIVSNHPERDLIFEPYPSAEEISKARTPDMLRKKLEEFLGSSSSGEDSVVPKPPLKSLVSRRPSVLMSEHGEEMSAAFQQVLASKRPGMLEMNLDTDEVMRLTVGTLTKHSDPGSIENLIH